MDEPRVELQAELAIPRERAFELLSTSAGLASWLDGADVETRSGGAVHLRLRDAVVEGSVVAFDPPQHLSFSWDYPDAPLGHPSVVAFDAIAHGARTHVTLRHVGLAAARQRDLHEALWRYWFARFREVARQP
jgi:uncharacterized protein YndB with AHSA1/START domain